MMLVRRKFFFTLIQLNVILLAFSVCYSQPPKFIKYSTQLGLSSNNQRCVIQDKEGFIWIGTGEGLNRFDGRTFKVYRKVQNDSTSLPSNIINCLYIDNKGILWVGTYHGGLSRYNKEKDNFYTYTANINDTTALLNNDITTIAEDKFSRLWIGTNSVGLHLFDPAINGFKRFVNTNTNKFDSNTIASNDINKIVSDNDVLWIAYNTGVLTSLNTSTMIFKHYKLNCYLQ